MTILAQTPASFELQPAVLMSIAKPLLVFPPMVFYAWMAASKFDRDSRYYQINPRMWASTFLGAAGAALAASLLIPIFWIGWPLEIIILGGTLIAYAMIRNKQVPEKARYSLGALKIGESLQARKVAAATKAASIRFVDHAKKERPVPLKEDPLFPVHSAAEMLLTPAIEGRAARFELGPTPQGFIPSQTADGVKYRRDPIPADMATSVIDYIKNIAGLDVAERRKRQTADFSLICNDQVTKVSITVLGGSTGQTMTLEFDREKQLSRPADSLGLYESQMKLLAPILDIANRRGVILVTTSPGHGLTTLMYSLLSRHDAFTCNVKSLEKQIELRVDGVDQHLFNPANDYATQLQSITRRGPDIVMVGDVTEPNTGKIITSPGNADMLFYVAVPVNSPPGGEIGAALREWFRAVGDLKAGAKPLKLVVAERLVRKLCEYCRQPHPRAADIAKRLGVPANQQPTLFTASGKVQVKNRVEDCPICKGSGFFGQVGVFEVVSFDDEARNLLAANDANGAYTTARRSARSPNLQEAALARVRDGTTSIEEFQRVMNPGKSGPPAAASSPPAPAAASQP